jgi:hypothetical protein
MRSFKGRLVAGTILCLASALSSTSASAQSTGSVGSLVADLYGGQGLLIPGSAPGHIGHFQASSREVLNNLSNIIAGNLGVISYGSSVGAVTFDIEKGVPVRTQESLGPIVAERASTIGAGRFNLGVSYTYVNYSRLNGVPLDRQTIILTHVQETGAEYEKDIVRLDLDIKLKQHILAFEGAYGITDNFDVAAIVPLLRNEGSVSSVATIIPFSAATAGFHRFVNESDRFSTNDASATGLGDILLRAKWQALDPSSSKLGLAVLTQVGLPTGDEKDLLGSGSLSVYGGGVVSASLGKFNPHLNVGYEHYFSQHSNLDVDRSNIRGAAGFDLKVRQNIAFATDVLARWRDDGEKFYDLAIGAKWAPTPSVPLYANVVVPMNRNNGLRPDFYFTFGLESTF